MNRVDGKCCGDCSRCMLLKDGEVDMIPCVLDQIFRRVQNNEFNIMELQKSINKRVTVNVASNEETV